MQQVPSLLLSNAHPILREHRFATGIVHGISPLRLPCLSLRRIAVEPMLDSVLCLV